MNIKYIFSKCITLLYREKQLSNTGVSSKPFVKEIISDIEVNQSSLTMDQENKVLYNLREIIVDMLRQPDEHEYDFTTFSQNLRIACDEQQVLFEGIRDAIALNLDEESLVKLVTNTRYELKNYLRDQQIGEIITKASQKLRYKSHEISDMRSYVNELVASLQPYQSVGEEEKDPAIMSEVDYTQIGGGAAEVFEEVRKEASGEMIIKTPWQAINRMTRGGFRRGQATVVAGLQHHGKSLITHGAVMGAALYNDPTSQMVDETKVPTILHISAEDEQEKVGAQMYIKLREQFEGVKLTEQELLKVTPSEMEAYTANKLSERGYRYLCLRVNPGEWTYVDICNYISRKEALGFEFHLCLIDYLNMFPKAGCLGDFEAARIQNLFQVMRNFMSKRHIAFVTPHQLSVDALELFRQGKRDLVNIVAGGSYYDACKGIGREVDLEIFIAKIEDSGRYYMTVRRGKHRIQGKTDEKHLYTVLPFEEAGDLRFDFDGPDTSLTKIGARRRSDGSEEEPFYDEDAFF